MPKTQDSQNSLKWGREYSLLPSLDLTHLQKEAYQEFLEKGIADTLSEISPLEDFTGRNWALTFGEHSIGQPRLTPQEARDKGLTYDISLKVEVVLTNKQTGENIKQEVFLADLPKMTDDGTFIINGIERCVVNQIVRSPGAYFTGTIDMTTGRTLYTAEIRPLRGSWLEFSVTRGDVLIARIDRRRKFPATTFLRALGVGSDEEILKIFTDVNNKSEHQFIPATLEKDNTKSTTEAILEIYRKMRVGEPIVLDNAQEFFNNLFFNSRRYYLGKTGRFKINKKLGLEIPNTPEKWVLTKEDVVAILSYLINLQNGHGRTDDIDHLGNRRVRRVGELVNTQAFRIGVLRLERAIKEKMSLVGPKEPLHPAQLVNARPVMAAVNDFFRTSQLSAILDQTNPLSEIDNLRRLSVMGVGGISRERASFSIRDVHSSQYGRICPVRSPEGPNIGLVTYLSLYARVNEYGFLETPYRKVVKEKREKSVKVRVTDEICYLAADEEENYYLTHAGVALDKNGYLLEERVPVRYRGDFLEADVENVDFIDLCPQQVVGTSASLIPFIAHDEATRALMGSHMQCQAVPLLLPHAPFVGTGMEEEVAGAMRRVVRVKKPGTVVYVDAQKVVIKFADDKETTYPVEKFKRTTQSTCYNQKPVVFTGDKAKAGQVIIDGPACDGGKLALGQNLTIAYASLEGLGYEDAIIISERLVRDDVLTSIHIEEYETTVVETKLGKEETTRDIPNVGEEDLANLDEQGIVVVGSKVGPDNILVGKIAPKGETELTAEERLLRAIFGEKAREVRDTSLRMPHGERGTVVGVAILDREKGDELEPGAHQKIIVKVAQMRKVVVGDKLAGRHGNKGVISKIVPQADMPYLEDGIPVDIIISPLSVLARMNLGQLLEAHLGWAAGELGINVVAPVFEHIEESRIINLLKEANLPVSGKARLFDGKTGEAFDQTVVIGKEYIMKLIHMVEDKTHARSTGPYSLVTQQPLGGKAQMGGQRLGEMEVWAMEAYRAAYTLQEMLTIKADDVVGRAKAFEAIVKGTDIPQSNIPESFKVLRKELQSLGLSVVPVGAMTVSQKAPSEEELKEEEKLEEKAKELAVASGEELTGEGLSGVAGSMEIEAGKAVKS
ncbi:MAG: DNA-directed RNA polymerase subunit beta [bacterium]|nr:DNA-directed RNA polymerase subunit beta [bacterium]